MGKDKFANITCGANLIKSETNSRLNFNNSLRHSLMFCDVKAENEITQCKGTSFSFIKVIKIISREKLFFVEKLQDEI